MVDFHPLSYNQELMLAYGAESGFGASQWNHQVVVDLQEFSDADVRDALRQLSLRHEILRTSIGLRGGRHCQAVDEPSAELPYRLDAAGPGGAGLVAGTELATPFDLHESPLWRGVAVPAADGGGRLILTFNHLVSDRQSEVMLATEFARRYEQVGSPLDCAPAPHQYAEFARWQRAQVAHYVRDPVSAPQWSVYENAVRALRPNRLARVAGPDRTASARSEAVLEFSVADTASLIACGRAHKVTLNSLFSAALTVAVSRLPDLNIGLVLGEKTIRYPYRFAETLGPFPDPWPISYSAAPEADFSATLSAIQGRAIQAIEVPLPFHVLVGRVPWLARELRDDHRPHWVFSQFFTDTVLPTDRYTRVAGIEFPDMFGAQSDIFGIHVLMRLHDDSLSGRMTFQTDSFGLADITVLANEIQEVLAWASGQPIRLTVTESVATSEVPNCPAPH